LTFSGLVSTLASAAPILNEVVAKNLSHPDAAGEYPDWIEIHNPDDSAFNLKDYHLSDDETNPTKWQFPEDLIVPANGYLIVFASGEDGMTAGHSPASRRPALWTNANRKPAYVFPPRNPNSRSLKFHSHQNCHYREFLWID
jgi:hypothetical protein